MGEGLEDSLLWPMFYLNLALSLVFSPFISNLQTHTLIPSFCLFIALFWILSSASCCVCACACVVALSAPSAISAKRWNVTFLPGYHTDPDSNWQQSEIELPSLKVNKDAPINTALSIAFKHQTTFVILLTIEDLNHWIKTTIEVLSVFPHSILQFLINYRVGTVPQCSGFASN